MNRRLQILTLLPLILSSALCFGQAQSSSPAQTRIQKEVRHELLMLPSFGVFDDIEYQVSGDTVTLLGSVTRPTLKSDAENVVKRIEGVSRVDNKIDVLRRLPWTTSSALHCSAPSMAFRPWRSTPLGVQKPIRIIVRNGHVELDGVVDNEADKNTAAFGQMEFQVFFR